MPSCAELLNHVTCTSPADRVQTVPETWASHLSKRKPCEVLVRGSVLATDAGPSSEALDKNLRVATSDLTGHQRLALRLKRLQGSRDILCSEHLERLG